MPEHLRLACHLFYYYTCLADHTRSGIMVGKNSPRLFPLISGRLIVACLVAKFYASASALCIVDDGGVGMDGHY